MFAPGALDVRISHRFGALNTGFYELFGLDQATIRMGLEYGLSNSIMPVSYTHLRAHET